MLRIKSTDFADSKITFETWSSLVETQKSKRYQLRPRVSLGHKSHHSKKVEDKVKSRPKYPLSSLSISTTASTTAMTCLDPTCPLRKGNQDHSNRRRMSQLEISHTLAREPNVITRDDYCPLHRVPNSTIANCWFPDTYQRICHVINVAHLSGILCLPKKRSRDRFVQELQLLVDATGGTFGGLLPEFTERTARAMNVLVFDDHGESMFKGGVAAVGGKLLYQFVSRKVLELVKRRARAARARGDSLKTVEDGGAARAYSQSTPHALAGTGLRLTFGIIPPSPPTPGRPVISQPHHSSLTGASTSPSADPILPNLNRPFSCPNILPEPSAWTMNELRDFHTRKIIDGEDLEFHTYQRFEGIDGFEEFQPMELLPLPEWWESDIPVDPVLLGEACELAGEGRKGGKGKRDRRRRS